MTDDRLSDRVKQVGPFLAVNHREIVCVVRAQIR